MPLKAAQPLPFKHAANARPNAPDTRWNANGFTKPRAEDREQGYDRAVRRSALAVLVDQAADALARRDWAAKYVGPRQTRQSLSLVVSPRGKYAASSA
jgi:hypothetical protein